MSHRRTIGRILALSLCALLTIGLFSKAHADDALPRDPGNVYGQYENGLKYIVRKNATPPGRVSVWLHVRAGALNETDSQNGLAHFIEHMAFNGSTHFKPGELIPLMNKLGMVFGADSNAHTTIHETVYKFNLPDTKPETIDTGLTVLSDVASGLALSDKEIDSERNVILEEGRSRKSVRERIQKQAMKQLFAGTKLADHDTLGDEEQIKTFPRAEFVDYWNTWYRPENMTLLVVGDVDVQAMIELGKQKFGPFAARAPARPAPKAGLKPFATPRVLIFTDPEQVGADVALTAITPSRGPVTTVADHRREAVNNLCEWIVNRRIDERISAGGAPFRDARIGSHDMFNEATMLMATSSGEPRDWNKMLDAIVAEVGRAIDHGFTHTELDLARSQTLSGAEQAVRSESTRESTTIVAMLAGAVGTDRPILSAQQRLDLTRQVLDTVTVEEIHKAFVENFKLENWVYALTLPEKQDGFTQPSEGEVLAAAKAAWARKTEAPAEKKLAGSLLAGEPVAGKIVKQETDSDLQITTAEFANGVVFHHKFVDYNKDSVGIKMTMPGGKIEETADNRGISELASLMLARPATSRFTSTQIRDLMTGKNVQVMGAIGLDALSVNVMGSKKDMAAGMQLAYAMLTDGVIEQSAVDEWAKKRAQMLEQMHKMPEGQLADAMAEIVYGGDVRMMPLKVDDINRLSAQRSAAEAWAKRIASSAAVEVTVVGDITLNDATELVAKYVGSLPQRTGLFNALDTHRKLSRGQGPYAKSVRFSSVTPKALVLAGVVSCDETDPERRPLSLAAMILSERMNQRIRETEQLVYSIGCDNRPGTAIRGTGMMMAAAPTDPHNADKLADTIIQMFKEFADTGPTEDELAVAKKQRAQELDRQMKQPFFWLAQIDGMRYRDRPLSDLKQIPGIFQTFTAQQVQEAARKYVKDDAVIRLEIIPEVTTGATTKPSDKVSLSN